MQKTALRTAIITLLLGTTIVAILLAVPGPMPFPPKHEFSSKLAWAMPIPPSANSLAASYFDGGDPLPRPPQALA